MTKPYQLLVANQTFVGFGRRPRRFKTVDPGFLPVFGKPAPNTSAVGSGTKHDGEDTTRTAQVANQCELPLFGVDYRGGGSTPKPGVSVAGKPTFKLPAAEARREVPREAQAVNAARGASRIWEFVSGSWRRRRRRATGTLAQGELALTAVRVVRNDLSDADIEIVQAKQTTGRADAEGSVAGHGMGAIFRRLVSRFNGQTVLRGNA